MDEKELKKLHGDDVELQPDNSEDERLTEKEALAQARAEGIEFVDHFSVDGDEENLTFDTRGEAEERADELGLDSLAVIQTRTRKVEE